MFAYDGTLVPFSSLPSLSRPPKSLLDCLAKLSEDEVCSLLCERQKLICFEG